jgi:phospholipid-binding lipoprotein MlaA
MLKSFKSHFQALIGLDNLELRALGSRVLNTYVNIGSARAALRNVFVVCAVLSVAACASAPKDPIAREAFLEANDPMESFNRGIYDINKALDDSVLKPVATSYRDFLPKGLQDGIRNFLNHLRTPIVLMNNLLQGDKEGAQITVSRFITNSVAGFGGFGDAAGDLGAKFRDEDFGQTLAVWGVYEGPYIMLPILGPSNPRDAVGLVVDSVLDPFNMWADNTDHFEATLSRSIVKGVDLRSRHIQNLEDLEKSSLDFYTTIRSLYRQLRTDAIANGDAGDSIPSPSISFDDEDKSLDQRARLVN